jgi:hypothetical protein
MLGFGGLMKIAKGGLGPDELAEVLSQMGMEVAFQTLPAQADSFEPLGKAASLPHAKIIELKGVSKDGGQIYALIVLNQ